MLAGTTYPVTISVSVVSLSALQKTWLANAGGSTWHALTSASRFESCDWPRKRAQ
jgi:hypothetical protein